MDSDGGAGVEDLVGLEGDGGGEGDAVDAPDVGEGLAGEEEVLGFGVSHEGDAVLVRGRGRGGGGVGGRGGRVGGGWGEDDFDVGCDEGGAVEEVGAKPAEFGLETRSLAFRVSKLQFQIIPGHKFSCFAAAGKGEDAREF